jgi:exonuclease VII small subunit
LTKYLVKVKYERIYPAIKVEIKDIEQAKDGLEKAIAKLRKAFKHMDKGDKDSLQAINMLENVRDDLDAWLEKYQSLAIEDKRKLEAWKLWATQ